MDHSTLVVLIFLTLGQIFMLTFGVLILWLAGEFGDAPKLFNDGHRTDQAEETTIAMREPSDQSNETGDGLMALAHDHSIQPRATEDRINQLEDDVEHSRERAVGAEK
jgi:hypothetical protein